MKKGKMKTLTALLVGFTLSMGTIAGCGQQSEKPTDPAAKTAETENEFDGEITFGVITSITGGAALGGANTSKGVQLACDEINAAGGVLGKKLVAQIEDDASAQTGAVNAANKLVGEGVVAILGPTFSTNVIAVDQIVEEGKTPLLVGGTSTKIYELENDYIYRVRSSDSLVAMAAVQYFYEDLGLKKIGLLTNNDDFGSGAKQVMMEYLEGTDAEVVAEGLNTGDKDLTGQITKMKQAGVEGLVYWGHEAEASLLARQRLELGLDVPVIASNAVTQVIGTVDGAEIDGWYIAQDLSMYDENEAIQNYSKAFQAAYGEVPELHSSTYYGATYLLADAIERAGSTDREAINEALKETKDVQGVIGKYNFQENHDMLNCCVITQYDAEKKEKVVSNVTVE